MKKLTTCYEILGADIPREEYLKMQEENARKSKKLQQTAKRWLEEGKAKVIDNRVDYKGIPIQGSMRCEMIPFRMLEFGDGKSTVKSSGCGLLTGCFMAEYFQLEVRPKIEEIAEAAVELNYRGYKKIKNEQGEIIGYIPSGLKHIFWERFVPSLYGVTTKRCEDITEIFKAVEEGNLPILHVMNSVYKGEKDSRDAHFLAAVGTTETGFLLYDSEYLGYIERPFDVVLPAIRNAWVVSK